MTLTAWLFLTFGLACGRAYLGDIHVSWGDLYPLERDGALRVVTYDDIPAGPVWWGPATPSNAATALTSSPNHLLEVAAEMLAEAAAYRGDLT